jgi:DNA-binding MarR family transcriptional regulator
MSTLSLAALTALLASEERVRGLHIRHLQLLHVLCERNEPVSVGELAALIRLSPSATSRVVERLVEEQMVSRAESPTDRRVMLIRPTESGRRTHVRVRVLAAAA